MESNLHDRSQLEQFLRNASAEELLEQRSRIEFLRARSQTPSDDAERLLARIGYELRFRMPQPI